MRKIIFIILFLVVAVSAALAVDFSGSKDAIKRFCSAPGMTRAHVGFCVMDLETGEMKVAYCERDSFIPASVTKLVTSATTMKAQPEGFSFITTVACRGSIDDNGTLKGDLVVRASLDPTVESRFFKEHPSFIAGCLRAVKRCGIKKIEGRVVVDNTIYRENPVPDAWEDPDVAEDYGAGLFAMNYADNQALIKYDSTADSFRLLDVTPKCAFGALDNRVRVVAAKSVLKLRFFRKKNSETLRISGSMSRRTKPHTYRTTMSDAHSAFVNALTDSLTAHGVEVVGREHERHHHEETIMFYSSPMLDDIVRSLLYRSDNMYAEAVLRGNSVGFDKTITRKHSLKKERHILKEWDVDLSHVNLYDGSGLSRSNHFTPVFLASTLRAAYLDPKLGERYSALLPVCGRDGTVRRLLKDTRLDGRIALKSGSMNAVQSYAGYFPADEPRYAVVLMANKFTCSHSDIRKLIETLLLGVLAEPPADESNES
ncbi:MAG: D-alanyl-D-alanine carboxypeptidase/D-alanyl-D-alanine-endopeptidase [Candidatus Limisoma sp.]